jgi:hypothetical protein
VHFWGLTCAPCIVELPAWAQLRRQCPDLALILVAADPVPRAAEEVARTLHEAGLGAAESWIFQPGQARRLYFEVDPDWQGELPRTVRLDRDGTALHHLGTSDMAALRAWYQRSSS